MLLGLPTLVHVTKKIILLPNVIKRYVKHLINKERLGINEVKQEYVNKLVNHIPEANEKNNLNWAWLQQIVINTANEVTDKRGKNGKEWMV